jgi:hypothetical protein
MRLIQAAFPDLRKVSRDGGETGSTHERGGASLRDGAPKPRRKRFTMSAEAKKAISLAQKRRWRKVRAAQKTAV